MEINKIEDELSRSIEKTDDPKDRAMLMLIQKVLFHVEKLLNDEEALRMRVLNGDYLNHSHDHDLIENIRKLDGLEAIKWVNNRRAMGGYCEFASRKIEEEKDSIKTLKGYWNNFISSIISDLPKVLLYAVIILAGYDWLIK